MDDRKVTIPLDIVVNANGLGIDIGGSAFKLIYIHKDDWERAKYQNPKPETVSVRLHTFSNTDFDEAVQFMKDNCVIIRDGDQVPTINTCGVTTNRYANQLKEIFNIKLEVISEGDSFVNAFYFLGRTIPWKEMILPENDEVVKQYDKTKTRIQEFNEMCSEKLGEEFIPKHIPQVRHKLVINENQPLMNQEENMFPCLLFFIGSAGGPLKLGKDGTFEFCDMINDAGRVFLGVTSLLTEGKSYDEVMKLIEGASDRDADIYTDEADMADTDDLYGDSLSPSQPMVACSFGKAINKNIADFDVGSLCRAYLRVMCVSIIDAAQSMAVRVGAQHVYFIGSFITHPFTRSMFDGLIPEATINLGAKSPLHFHYFHHGSHYGALGAMLNHTLKFLQPQSKMAAASATDDTADQSAKEEGVTE